MWAHLFEEFRTKQLIELNIQVLLSPHRMDMGLGAILLSDSPKAGQGLARGGRIVFTESVDTGVRE